MMWLRQRVCLDTLILIKVSNNNSALSFSEIQLKLAQQEQCFGIFSGSSNLLAIGLNLENIQ